MLPPYLLRTPRLTLRCLGPEDVAPRKEAVDSSGDHLKGFFPPKDGAPWTLEAHAAQVRNFRGRFDSDADRAHAVIDTATGRYLGEVSLLKRAGIDALEIGYWIREDATGRGIATEMAQAALKIAFEFDGVKRMDLNCAPENERSAAVARRVGFVFEGRLRDRQLAPHHARGDLLCFTMLASEYARNPAKALPLEAFDFLGRPIRL